MKIVRYLLNCFRECPSDLWLGFIQNMPGRLGFRLRSAFWKKRLKFLGTGVRIDQGVYFQSPSFVSIGDNSWIDRGVMILAGPDDSDRKKKRVGSQTSMMGEVSFGENCHIGSQSIISGIDAGVSIGCDCTLSANVKIYAFSHHYRFDDAPDDVTCSYGSMVSYERQSIICGPVVLEDNVGVALNSVLLPGVRIGRNSFVSINSVLFNVCFGENSLIGGNPAVLRRKRFVNERDGTSP